MKKYIEIRGVTCLRGPNMWTYRPVIEARVDIGALEDSPSNTIPGFYERLTAWLPSLSEHRCSYGEPGGFLQRLREGTWPGHILEHVTLELQNLAGLPGGFGRARETSVRGVYKVVVRSWHEAVTETALMAGRDLVMAAIEDRPFDVQGTVAQLRAMADSLCLGPSTMAIVTAAEERCIPAIRLSEGNLVQLGHGANQHRIWTAETDLTSAIAQGIARDRDLARGLLRACGVPTPDGRLVTDAEDAWEAAESIGGPVVVKPNSGSHGRAVFVGLTDRGEIERAYAAAYEEDSEVIVETCIEGDEHRLLVIGDRLVAAARGEPLKVTGDASNSIRELIQLQINSDPRRGDSPSQPLLTVDIDAVVEAELARQGYTPDSIPAANAEVVVRRFGNVAIDATEGIHPTVAHAAILAAKTVGLDIAGIDLVTRDATRPLGETGGAVVGVHSGPGLLVHLHPTAGAPRPVGHAIIEHLFPGQHDGRVPIVGITGTRETTMIARLLARLVQLTNKRVGLACADGLYLDRRQVQPDDCANFDAAHRILLHRGVEAAVLENRPYSMVAEGLAYDRCHVGVVTAIDPDQRIEEFDIQTPEQMYNVLRTQIDVVLPGGVAVLNAQDPLVASMAQLCDGEVILFSTDAEHEAIRAHRADGRRCVVALAGRVVLISGSAETILTDLAKLALSSGKRAEMTILQILAAVGAAWALGLSHEILRAGIETFDPDLQGPRWAAVAT